MAKEKELHVIGLDETQDNTIIEVKEVKKDHKLVNKYKGLKTWQKVIVWVTGTAVVVGAGYGLTKILSPETSSELVEAVAETATEEGLNVVNF